MPALHDTQISVRCGPALALAAALLVLPSPAMASGRNGWRDPRIDRALPRAPLLPFRERLLGLSSPASQRPAAPGTGGASTEDASGTATGAPPVPPLRAGAALTRLREAKAAPTGARSRTQGEGLLLAWERQYADNSIPPRDNANALAIDSSGNVYVTGYSEATYSSGDYVTVKYTALGDSLWSRRYNGTGNDVDEATAIGIGPDGNVLVTGYSYNEAGNTDIVTLKYDANGTLVWERRYGGEAESTDVATALGIDAEGNVFVTGYSYGTASLFDYLTISYAPDGSLRWAARYDGEGHGTDVPTALAVTADGGVIVTGFSDGALSGPDITTVRYLANGAELWHARYNGPANGDDRGNAVIAGSDGSCWVTGSVMTNADHNYLTVKYDQSGSVVWSAEYDGTGGNDDRAIAAAFDGDGNIIVTGFSVGSNGHYGFATVKYDASGTEVWIRRHTMPPNTDGFATALVSSPRSGITITGYVNDNLTTYSTIMTIRYDSSGTELWANPYDGGQAHSYDIGIGVVCDSAGNALVAGTAIGADGSPDYVVIRYDAPRFPYWPVRFDATGNVSEKLSAMALDRDGNVYVTGFGYLQSVAAYGVITAKFTPDGALVWQAFLDSAGEDFNTPVIFVGKDNSVYVGALSYYGGSSRSAFITAKYAGDGSHRWTSRYELLRQSEIKGIVADPGGNVYIAGTNFYQRQMIAIKYSSDGVYQWGNFQNGAAGAIGIDSSGCVVVTGTADGLGTGSNIVTVKFDPSGQQRWTASYAGPNGSIDGSTALSIDASGNVFVAGSVYTQASGYQFVLVRYDSTGSGRWAALDADTGRSYSSPVSVVASYPGRIVLTGRSPSTNNYSTTAYDSGGSLMWRSAYDGDVPGIDDPHALAVTSGGEAVVTGTSPGLNGSTDFVTVRYANDGTQQWVARYNSPANGADDAAGVAVDANGYTFVAGTSKGDYLIQRIDLQGNFVSEPDYRWPVHFDGAGLSDDFPAAIAADSSGSVAVAGSTTAQSLQNNMFLMNYSGEGAQYPPSVYTGNGFGALARGVAVDRAGNRYLTGDILRQIGTTDIATVKYAPDGTRAWVAKYNGLSDSYDFARAITVDDSGSAYTAGYSIGRGTGYDFVVIKYGPNGTQEWEARYNGPANGDDILAAMQVDAERNVYVTGTSAGAGGKGDFATVKYDRTGAQLWAARYDGPASDDDRASALALDNLGNVYVTGSVRTASGYYDFATVKYDSGGTQQWAVTYDGPGQKDDVARAIAVDGEYHVTITGESDGGPTSRDFATLQYDVGGQLLWQRRFDGGASGDDSPRAMAIDPDGSVYVTGKSKSTDGTNDMATIKYLKDGTIGWSASYALGPSVDDEPAGIVLDAARNVYVTGRSYGALWSVATTVKYAQTVAGAVERRPALPSGYRLFGNYPNPFNPVTTIRFAMPAGGHVRLKIYNGLGEEIATLVDGARPPGVHSAQWNAEGRPSGVYFVKMTAGSFVATQKLLLVK